MIGSIRYSAFQSLKRCVCLLINYGRYPRGGGHDQSQTPRGVPTLVVTPTGGPTPWYPGVLVTPGSDGINSRRSHKASGLTWSQLWSDCRRVHIVKARGRPLYAVRVARVVSLMTLLDCIVDYCHRRRSYRLCELSFLLVHWNTAILSWITGITSCLFTFDGGTC